MDMNSMNQTHTSGLTAEGGNVKNAGKPTVLLIDLSAVFRRCWHVSSQVSHAYEGSVSSVRRAISMTSGCLTAVCCDGRGNWRKEISREYKAQREAQPAEMYGQLDRVKDRLRRDGLLLWEFPGFEADDVIASAVMMACTRGHSCRIVSHDKDLLQLLGTWCDFVAIHKTPWEVVGPDIVREKYGVDPERLGDWLALVGDTSDNVKGCPGVGAKTATALLQAHETLGNLLTRSRRKSPTSQG
jgi:DNA polymerase-1